MKNSDSSQPSVKRQKPRYQLALKAEVWVKGLEHHQIERTANVSATGLFLCTDLELAPGDVLHLRIIFKDLEAFFDSKAKVVWKCDGLDTHPKGLGLQFVELNQSQVQVIERYLKNYITVKDL